MLAGSLRTDSLPTAVQKTFDGKHPCALCKQIAKGKQAERKTEFKVESNKFEFSYTNAKFTFYPPAMFSEVRPSNLSSQPLTHAPPVPPPRALLG
jgi:hypothetical protein